MLDKRKGNKWHGLMLTCVQMTAARLTRESKGGTWTPYNNSGALINEFKKHKREY